MLRNENLLKKENFILNILICITIKGKATVYNATCTFNFVSRQSSLVFDKQQHQEDEEEEKNKRIKLKISLLKYIMRHGSIGSI